MTTPHQATTDTTPPDPTPTTASITSESNVQTVPLLTSENTPTLTFTDPSDLTPTDDPTPVESEAAEDESSVTPGPSMPIGTPIGTITTNTTAEDDDEDPVESEEAEEDESLATPDASTPIDASTNTTTTTTEDEPHDTEPHDTEPQDHEDEPLPILDPTSTTAPQLRTAPNTPTTTPTVPSNPTFDDPTFDMFLTAPDPNLNCCICQDVMTNPHRTPCGHVFCHTCIHDWLDLDNHTCVTCRQPLLSTDLQPDRILESIIGNLSCRCPNTTCTWMGKHTRLPHHLAHGCTEEIVPCPHTGAFGCPFKNKRKHLHDHLATCKYEQVKDILYAQRDENTKTKKRLRDQDARLGQLENVILERSQRWLKDVRVDDKLDAMDGNHRWFEATVIGIPDATSLEVHFDGWNDKHDAVLARDSGRLAPLHSHSSRRRKRRRTTRNWRDFEEGDVVDCCDSVGNWYEAVVIDVEEDQVFIHYEGWPNLWDEHISVQSSRLAPLRTHSVAQARRRQPSTGQASTASSGSSEPRRHPTPVSNSNF